MGQYNLTQHLTLMITFSKDLNAKYLKLKCVTCSYLNKKIRAITAGNNYSCCKYNTDHCSFNDVILNIYLLSFKSFYISCRKT